jgi:type 1 glutamine amidotransferase
MFPLGPAGTVQHCATPMTNAYNRGVRCLPLIALLAACGNDTMMPPVQDDRVLVYTRMLGFRHDEALAAAMQVLPGRLATEGIKADFTEDPAQFTEETLHRYRAVIFLYTSGNDVLDAAGKAELEKFVRRGGGWMGVHSAADTEYMWPFYKTMLVSYFMDHPAVQQATVTITLSSHQAMVNVPAEPWAATDEWYNFASNPRSVLGVDVLATVDETTYTGGTMGTDHPIIWVQERLVGRTLFTALGHEPARWQETAFVEHIASSVRWVTGLAL